MNKKIGNTFSSIITYTLIAIGSLIICFNIYFIVTNKASDKLPDIFGYKLLIELSDSMYSEIATGDLVIIKDIDPLDVKKDDVLSFRDKNNLIITHRVTNIIRNDGEVLFETKGDNNTSKDIDLVEANQVEGIMICSIRKLGYVFSFLSTTIGKIVVILIAVIIFLISLFIREIKKEAKSKDKLELV